ncbi:unnamed protein product [Parajaminaea phylloscopi]
MDAIERKIQSKVVARPVPVCGSSGEVYSIPDVEHAHTPCRSGREGPKRAGNADALSFPHHQITTTRKERHHESDCPGPRMSLRSSSAEGSPACPVDGAKSAMTTRPDANASAGLSPPPCPLGEMFQYDCRVDPGNVVVCQTIARIFRMCPGRPFVEVTDRVVFDDQGRASEVGYALKAAAAAAAAAGSSKAQGSRCDG